MARHRLCLTVVEHRLHIDDRSRCGVGDSNSLIRRLSNPHFGLNGQPHVRLSCSSMKC